LAGKIFVRVRRAQSDYISPAARREDFLDMLGVFAEFETNLRRERQLEGIAAAKAKGLYKGRPRSIDAGAIKGLRMEGLGAMAIAKRLGIGRATVYRLTGDARNG
jgi:DNA invertase Pin-like site-specific DNA recombinase